ncbi:MAG: hypothetical protein K2H65_03715, partial [Bacteroidales bacterium]|nr:hypothetical protein [Bacteroidales bacterium]
MKKLTMALLSLMLLLGLGTASAQLSAPTTTPADGATVAPGDNVTFWINDDYEAWTVIIYTFDPAVQLADVVVDGDLIGEIMDGGGKDGVKGCVLMAASGYAVDPSDPGAGATMAWAPGVTIPVDASGTITLQARATDVMGQNASSVATIHYTAEGEAAPVIAPTFSLADGTVVEANAKVSVLYDGPDREGTTMYKVLYVVDDPDFNFAQYDNFDDVPTKIIYTNPIAITKNTTITAITVKYDGVLEDIIGWSEKVSASYTVKPNEPDPTPVVKPAAPTFNPDGGAVTSGTKVLLTNGTEGDATPKPIYYNFKNNTDAFNEVKTQKAFDDAVKPGLFQKMMLYTAEGNRRKKH